MQRAGDGDVGSKAESKLTDKLADVEEEVELKTRCVREKLTEVVSRTRFLREKLAEEVKELHKELERAQVANAKAATVIATTASVAKSEEGKMKSQCGMTRAA